MCCRFYPELAAQREECCIIPHAQLSILEEEAKDYPGPIFPPTQRGEEDFDQKMDELFEMHADDIIYSQTSFPDCAGAVPREVVERLVEETCSDARGDFTRVTGYYEDAVGPKEAGQWERTRREGTAEQREKAAKKVAWKVVSKGLAKHTGHGGDQFYLQFNLSGGSKELEYMEKHWYNSGSEVDENLVKFHEINEAHRSILAFVGGEGNWTPLHVDWTSAENVAFLVSSMGVEVDYQKPAAIWYFIHPRAIRKVDEWIKLNCQNGAGRVGLRCGKAKMPFLTEKQFEELKAYCGCDPITGEYYCIRVEQMHGMKIKFVPGYLHQVVTLQPSIKLAWDVYRVDKLQKNIEVWIYIICQFMHADDIAEDYMNILNLVLAEVLNPLRIPVGVAPPTAPPTAPAAPTAAPTAPLAALTGHPAPPSASLGPLAAPLAALAPLTGHCAPTAALPAASTAPLAALAPLTGHPAPLAALPAPPGPPTGHPAPLAALLAAIAPLTGHPTPLAALPAPPTALLLAPPSAPLPAPTAPAAPTDDPIKTPPSAAPPTSLANAPAEYFDEGGISPTGTPAAAAPAVDPTSVVHIDITPMDIDGVGGTQYAAHGHSEEVDLRDSSKPPLLRTVRIDTPLPVDLVGKVRLKYQKKDDNVLDFSTSGRYQSVESRLCEWVKKQTIEQQVGENRELRVGTLQSKFAKLPKDTLIHDLRRFHDTTWLNENCIDISMLASLALLGTCPSDTFIFETDLHFFLMKIGAELVVERILLEKHQLTWHKLLHEEALHRRYWVFPVKVESPPHWVLAYMDITERRCTLLDTLFR